MKLDVSVIIPCLNEITTINEVLLALRREFDHAQITYEIIVVDNGSDDGSGLAAKKLNAKVLYTDARTVSAVRNFGVNSSIGNLLIFIDADILVKYGWGNSVKKIIAKLAVSDDFITGSHPLAPNNINPLLYSWFKAISLDKRDTHLGTGHMIVSRKNFFFIGAFNEELISGEDYYFCSEAKKNGINIISDAEMIVFHLDYPNSLLKFMRREIWHGLGDCKNLKNIFQSRMAWLGFIYLLVATFIIPLMFKSLLISFFLLNFLLVLACIFNYYKFKYGNFKDFKNRSIVSFIYLLSRGLSLPIYFIKKRYTH